MTLRPTLFIGSSSEAKHIADAMQANLERDIEPTVWDQSIFLPSEGFLESLVKAVNSFDFGVFVLSRDDAAVTRGAEVETARDNVVFEAGMFAGKLGRERVFLVVPHDGQTLHLPTDLLGTTTLFYDGMRQDGNWEAATATACNKIKTIAKRLGGIRASRGIVAYGDTVVLATFDGCYVQVAADERGTLTATSRDFGEWDRFEVVSAIGAIIGRSVKIGDKIGLKAVKSGKYASADFNIARSVGAWISKLDPWETFVVRSASPKYAPGDSLTYGTSFALLVAKDKDTEGVYVAFSPNETRTFWAAASGIGPWERLMFVEPE